MKIVAMLRVKNEERWLQEVLESILPLTEEILLFDDHSTDATRDIAEALKCTVIPSPFDPFVLDETRDVIPEFVEELLPFYSESSVRLRELVHDSTADGSWEWRQEGRNLFFYRPAGVNQAAVSSTVPALKIGRAHV